MSWKEICPMDERMKFIAACIEETESHAALCRRYGISRKTGYKWIARYEAQGAAGLAERRPVARQSPHKVPGELADAVVGLRKEHPTWGPKKLRAVLLKNEPQTVWPAASTMGDLLKTYGMIRPRRRRIHVAAAMNPLNPCAHANDVWCVDFKGHFALGDRSRCYPLTLTDAYSRYLLKCEVLVEARSALVRRQFELAFIEFGMPWWIRSDNGAPFASLAVGGLSKLSVWWIQLGIRPERIEPGKPQQNGRHERMHRTLKQDATQPPSHTGAEQQRRFDLNRREFNELRPHEALGQTTPATHYEPSRRPYPRELVPPSYGDDCRVRWLDAGGKMSWHGRGVVVGAVLANQPVGIRQVSPSTHEAWYGPILLGTLDDKDKVPRLRPIAKASLRPSNGDGDGFAFYGGQPSEGLTTAKPPSPETNEDEDFWREDT